MDNNRIEQINNVIQKILAEMIAKNSDSSQDMVISLTRVACSGNLQIAKVYISVLPDNRREKTVAALNKDIINFQKILNKKMRMRPVPRIEFLPDTTPEAAQTVETILEKIKNESSGKVEN